MRTGKVTRFEQGVARFAPLILALAIAIAAAVAFREGRNMTFTPDEWFWVISSPGMDLKTAFLTSTGHLQLVPRVVYKVLLEAFGTDYVWYRLLTVVALALTVTLFYRYLSRRVGPVIALIAAIIMLFFGSDALHLIRGNGFTILLSIACGIGALLALERDDRRGDVGACLLLVLGLSTYTNALPFVAGAGVYLLIGREWKRLWVPLVPVVLYGGWKIWLGTTGPSSWGGTLHTENFVRIPAWIFDALSSILSAITGLGYGFAETSASGPDDLIGPVLAVLFIAALVWRLSRGSIGRGIWVTLAIGATLWSIQCLASDPAFPDFRSADDTRYLYPGAIVVFMIGAELCAGKAWPRPALVAFVLVALFGLATNFNQIIEYSKQYRLDSAGYQRTISTYGVYLDESRGRPVDPITEPVIGPTFDELNAAMASRPFGGISLTTDELLALPESDRAETDSLLAGYFGISLTAGGRPTGHCAVVEKSGDGSFESVLPAGRVILETGRMGGRISLGRFADAATVDLGRIPPRAVRNLTTAEPLVDPPWRISFTRPGLKLCRPEKS